MVFLHSTACYLKDDDDGDMMMVAMIPAIAENYDKAW